MLESDTSATRQQVTNLIYHGNSNFVLSADGHRPFPLGGSGCSAEAQPLYTNAPFGIALAHNGNLTNTDELSASMKQERRHINTNSDSGSSRM
jgi:glutamine phosphoribosylpyrophosphate amidotransferase